MNYFTDLYFKTIDPSFRYIELLNIAVFYSIILHTIVYSIIVLIIKKSFDVKINTIFLIFSLFVVMTFGYVGRLMRSKSIYNNLIKKNYNDKDATQETVNIMHQGYFRFYFIG
jgi:hypothetical protein|tara:strand:- start:1231 stop:1569 length:339 start_codon:yes stop_codon:yes gene_type:complete